MSSLKLITKHYLKMNYYLISNWPDLSIYPYYSLTFGSGYFPKYRLFKGRWRQPVFTLIKEDKNIFHISSDYSIARQIKKESLFDFFAGFTSWVTQSVKKQFRKQMFPFFPLKLGDIQLKFHRTAKLLVSHLLSHWKNVN